MFSQLCMLTDSVISLKQAKAEYFMEKYMIRPHYKMSMTIITTINKTPTSLLL